MEPSPTRQFFDRLAAAYADERYGPGADPWRAYFFGERLRHLRELLERPKGLVLDLGSGPGVLPSALDLPPERFVHVDLSPEMLRRAPGAAAAGDARAIPLRDGSVGAVVALGLTTYLPDLDGLLREAARVLVPGGRLVLSITRRGSPDTALRAAFRATVGRLRRGGGLLGAGLPLRSWSDREAARALRRAGFRVRARRRHNYTVFPFCYLLRGPSLALARPREDAPGRLAGLASDALLLAERAMPPPPRSRRLVRVIARLNVGGPARQAILLTRTLPSRGWRSTLVTGPVAPFEGDMLPAARSAGVEPVMLPGPGRALSAAGDLRSFLHLLCLLLRERPHVVHTHTAKAGALGRVAAVLAGVPVRIHTFHGHVLHGYFGALGSALARATERVLSRLATRLVAVSPEVRRDLAVRHRIAPASRIDVVPLGLPLDDCFAAERRRGELRAELGIPPGAPVVAVVGRVTPVKAPELMLAVAREVLRVIPETRFVVAGGGESFPGVERRVREEGLAASVLLLGWREDLDRILADADVALLTSRNEGTPVALIEAAAAGVPAVATRVGGVPSVVEDGVSGLLAPFGDAAGLADALGELLRSPGRRAKMGAAARERARRFTADRLTGDLDALYRWCLGEDR